MREFINFFLKQLMGKQRYYVEDELYIQTIQENQYFYTKTLLL